MASKRASTSTSTEPEREVKSPRLQINLGSNKQLEHHSGGITITDNDKDASIKLSTEDLRILKNNKEKLSNAPKTLLNGKKLVCEIIN